MYGSERLAHLVKMNGTCAAERRLLTRWMRNGSTRPRPTIMGLGCTCTPGALLGGTAAIMLEIWSPHGACSDDAVVTSSMITRVPSIKAYTSRAERQAHSTARLSRQGLAGDVCP